MKKPKCEDCKYFDAIADGYEKFPRGWCRKALPTVAPYLNGPSWPLIYPDDWCGEYAQKITKPGEKLC